MGKIRLPTSAAILATKTNDAAVINKAGPTRCNAPVGF